MSSLGTFLASSFWWSEKLNIRSAHLIGGSGTHLVTFEMRSNLSISPNGGSPMFRLFAEVNRPNNHAVILLGI